MTVKITIELDKCNLQLSQRETLMELLSLAVTKTGLYYEGTITLEGEPFVPHCKPIANHKPAAVYAAEEAVCQLRNYHR